uniref:50S ribosomal protein L20 n=1 Tax=Rhipiliopsis peltata TaxID=2320810 RepID=A0A386B1D3_9CHLO|nr:ribosomal protein L20 [Rhipiliopsis peltata]AYC65505.1 ribosomal protein L20 [Rhipiliopsis peltata]
MTRVKRGYHGRKRHKKKLLIAKGFRGASSLLFKNANQQFLKAFQNAFTHRRLRKRYFRAVWICRTNAKARQFGFNYAELRHSFSQQYSTCSAAHLFNRKILAQLALYDG